VLWRGWHAFSVVTVGFGSRRSNARTKLVGSVSVRTADKKPLQQAQGVVAMQLVEVILLVLAMLAMVIGLFSLSQATAGVGGIAAACFLAILARIAQAAHHTDELKKLIEHRTDNQTPPTKPVA
jgi:hypothetical protein